MTIQFYNTLTREKEPALLKGSKAIKMYSCGPTVYDYAHIGNFRAYIFADLVKRYLKFREINVYHVMNLTDVDDKTIKGSIEKKESLENYTDKYAQAFFEDLVTLGIDKADIYPRATQHIAEMLELIDKLMAKGIAYKSADGIYFSISKLKTYGELAQLKQVDLKTGTRIATDNYEKETANDFVLWKFYKKEDGNVKWDSKYGVGRPGWHLECSAMSMKYLGESFDIHTGGVDLIFPHHVNEIAQSEGASGKKFVRIWMHNEHLLVDSKKMSKSLGNFYTLRDVIKKGHNANTIRFALLSTHYRQQLNFTFESLNGAKNTVDRIQDFANRLFERAISSEKGEADATVLNIIETQKVRFIDAMDDDLNISEALSALSGFMKDINIIEQKMSAKAADLCLQFLLDMNKVLVILETPKMQELELEFKELIKQRELARSKKDFEESDRIRKELLEKGIAIDDTPKGVRWRKV